MFREGSEYTRAQIHARIRGGLQSRFLTHGGSVAGICFVPAKNPSALSSIFVGHGPLKERAAELLATSGDVIPVFSKQAPNAWKYIGNFRAKTYSHDAAEVQSARDESGRRDVVGVLYLSRVT